MNHFLDSVSKISGILSLLTLLVVGGMFIERVNGMQRDINGFSAIGTPTFAAHKVAQDEQFKALDQRLMRLEASVLALEKMPAQLSRIEAILGTKP